MVYEKGELDSQVSSWTDPVRNFRVEVESKNAERVAFGVHRDKLKAESASQKTKLDFWRATYKVELGFVVPLKGRTGAKKVSFVQDRKGLEAELAEA